jgi:hypothetical protein
LPPIEPGRWRVQSNAGRERKKNMSLQWYLMLSKLNQEEALYARLLADRFEVYYPCIRVKPVNPRARKIKAYFPGCLFVHLDLQTVGISFRQFTPYAKGLVCVGCEPVPISEPLLAAIRRRVDEFGNPEIRALPVNIRAGKASIQEGFSRETNFIINGANSGRERVRWLIEILSQCCPPGEVETSTLALMKKY